MKNNSKKTLSRKVGNNFRSWLKKYSGKRKDISSAVDVIPDTLPAGPPMRALITRDVFMDIYNYTREFPHNETGGCVFGYASKDSIVVLGATGPGPGAFHGTAKFKGDLPWLEKRGREITGKFGLLHLGDWHSHHSLGLPHPSGWDIKNVRDHLKDMGANSFLTIITGFQGGRTFINPFIVDFEGCHPLRWEIIPQQGIVNYSSYGYAQI